MGISLCLMEMIGYRILYKEICLEGMHIEKTKITQYGEETKSRYEEKSVDITGVDVFYQSQCPCGFTLAQIIL